MYMYIYVTSIDCEFIYFVGSLLFILFYYNVQIALYLKNKYLGNTMKMYTYICIYI